MGPSGAHSAYGVPAFLFSPVLAAAVQAGGQVGGAAVGGRSGVRMAEIGAQAQAMAARQQLEAQKLSQQMGGRTLASVEKIAIVAAATVVAIVAFRQLT